MRGEVSVYLKRDGKIVEKVQAHNLVTNAVNEFYHRALTGSPNYDVRVGTGPYITYHYQCCLAGVTNEEGDHSQNIVFPMPNKGLGGILLFDDALAANAAHVKLMPGDPHIIGFANQSDFTSDEQSDLDGRGKISSDSGSITNGYRLVWEWKDNALVNEPVKAVSLTNVYAGAEAGPFRTRYFWSGNSREEYWRWSKEGLSDSTFFYYDENNERLYSAKFTELSSGVNLKITQHTLAEGGLINTNGVVYNQDFTGIYFSFVASAQWICYGYDGYAYCVYWDNADIDGTIKFFKIALDNAPTFTVTVDELDMSEYPDAYGRTIMNGYFYYVFTRNHQQYLGRARLSDGESDYISVGAESISSFPHPTIGGDIALELTGSASGIIKTISGDLNGKFITWPSLSGSERRLRDLNSTGLMCVDEYGSLHLMPGYLGTIYNLPTPVTKTSEKETLVVQYDLIME